MIPTRYLGPVHALGLTYREEGIRGLYRGYCAYALAVGIYLAVVPLVTEMQLCRMAIAGGKKRNNSDELMQDLEEDKRKKKKGK